MPGVKKERLHFFTFKCKLQTVVQSKVLLQNIKSDVVLAHQVFKRASAFFRLYCLCSEEVPGVNESTMKQCINQVTIREARGVKRHKD